jgi:hypothetical protein
MIAMQVGNEDVINAMHVQLILHELKLGAFSTINQKVIVLYFNELSGRHPTVSWYGSAGSKDGNFKGH